MKTFHYSIENTNSIAMSDTEIVLVAESREQAIEYLEAQNHEVIEENLIELKQGYHIIQYPVTY